MKRKEMQEAHRKSQKIYDVPGMLHHEDPAILIQPATQGSEKRPAFGRIPDLVGGENQKDIIQIFFRQDPVSRLDPDGSRVRRIGLTGTFDG